MKTAAILIVTGLATAANAGIYSGSGGEIPDFGSPSGNTLTSSIVVSGDRDFPITSVVVSLQGLTHTWIGDLVATLTSPSGTAHTLFSRIRLSNGFGSGDTSDFNGTYPFATTGGNLWAAAASALSSEAVAPGIYQTSAGDTGAPTSINAAFAGQNGNGIWTLSISDFAEGDTGGLIAWQLTIVPSPGAAAVLGLSGFVVTRRRRA
jgi:subtilisin-like proprotein convertase family protein